MFRIQLLPVAAVVLFGISACADSALAPEGEAAGLFTKKSASSAGTAGVSTTGVPLMDLGPGLAFAINERGAVAMGYQGQVSVWHQGTFELLTGPPASPEAINERGQVAGRSFAGRALLWDRGTVVDLGTLGGANAWANDVSNRGQVVGWSRNSGLFHRAFLWADGEMLNLGTLGGYQSWANGINDRGQVVGMAWTGNGSEHAFLWDKGIMKDLGTLDGLSSQAEEINNRGQAVGSCQTGQPPRSHACLWSRGEVLDLGTLGGDYSAAYSISENGLIAGISSVVPVVSGPIYYHGFLWQNGEMTDLGTLGGCCSHAVAVNNRGEVVGWAYDASWGIHAVLWKP